MHNAGLVIWVKFEEMNPENKLKEILIKVDNLTHDIHECRQEIAALKERIFGD